MYPVVWFFWLSVHTGSGAFVGIAGKSIVNSSKKLLEGEDQSHARECSKI